MRPFARYDCREAGLPEPGLTLTDGFLTILRRPLEQIETEEGHP